MPSANKHLLSLAAVLALSSSLPSAAAGSRGNLRKNRNPRRDQVHHVEQNAPRKDGGSNAGLEEDVVFWTRLLQAGRGKESDFDGSMPSIPRPPTGGGDNGGGRPVDPGFGNPNLPPTNPPNMVDPPMTDPPAGGGPGLPIPTPAPGNGLDDDGLGPPLSPAPTGGGDGSAGGGGGTPTDGTITFPPVPVAAVICAQDEVCTEEGSTCSDGTTVVCCGEEFDAFSCACEGSEGDLKFDCGATNACEDITCDEDGDVSDDVVQEPPSDGFNCPAASFVGCTATDLNNPVDDCDVVGEPCEDDVPGTFCCLDACPRKYCTAKQAPMSVRTVEKPTTETASTAFLWLPLPDDFRA